jgi:hypothetical protein
MAAPEPPPKVPRIVDVQEPGTGHYVVIVRMPMDLVSSFPSTPWNTDISQIGLPKADSDKYPEHELVQIASLQGTNDLLWFFQKLEGPLWTSTYHGIDSSLIPAKYRRLIEVIKTKQEVVPSTPPDTIAGDLIYSAVERQDDTGKSTKTNITEVIDIDASPLIGELTDTWGVNTTEESLVQEGDPCDFGYGTKSSVVAPLGNGKSVKSSEFYPADDEDDGIIHTLEGREVDEETGIIYEVTKSLVDRYRAKALADNWPGIGDGTVEIKPLDKWHSIIVTGKIVEDSLRSHTWWELTNINLPNELEEVGVIWDSDSNGGADTNGMDNRDIIIANNLGWRVEASASVSGSVMGAPYTKFKAGFNGYAKVKVTRTFHKDPPDGQDFSVQNFSAGYGTITIFGAQASIVCQAFKAGRGAFATSSGGGRRFHYDKKMTVHTFGPCVMSSTLVEKNEGDGKFLTDSYTAVGGSTPDFGLYPAATASIELEGRAQIHLPTTAGPASGSSYIAKVDIRPWRLGYWVKEVYEVFVP